MAGKASRKAQRSTAVLPEDNLQDTKSLVTRAWQHALTQSSPVPMGCAGTTPGQFVPEGIFARWYTETRTRQRSWSRSATTCSTAWTIVAERCQYSRRAMFHACLFSGPKRRTSNFESVPSVTATYARGHRERPPLDNG
ncbi:hypothetical protein CCMA1212_006179 [Trichoderma ghanense]|uniref:Uncharacterized protein n=1 Tax=Trichoderma ghanense TaxID=65468 RepID=A0ABY2H288_9HYPO